MCRRNIFISMVSHEEKQLGNCLVSSVLDLFIYSGFRLLCSVPYGIIFILESNIFSSRCKPESMAIVTSLCEALYCHDSYV